MKIAELLFLMSRTDLDAFTDNESNALMFGGYRSATAFEQGRRTATDRPEGLRSSIRRRVVADFRSLNVGFRLDQDIE